MEKKWQPTMITTSETVLHANLLTTTGQRLTPTGKISHAKTRVYTQRYRKEWEQMPDFKGWLTSVPFQPTRAYCMYCKKNLHAHRLSLLKHTCTMKHQRAALLHDAEEKKKAAARKGHLEEKVEVEEVEEIETMEHTQTEVEENEDEVEYVVERLETDDELDETQIKHPSEDVTGEVEDEEEEEEDDVGHMASDDDDVKDSIKNIKIERVGNCDDSLTEAMDHMESEYLEDTDNHETVQMEIVVESEDQSNPEMQVVSILPDIEDSNKDSPRESRENERAIRRGDSKLDRKSAKLLQDECKQQGDSGIMVACPLPILGTTYQINSSVAPTTNTIGVLQPVNTIPIAPTQSKTITLTSGGKTLTLTGGTFQPGTQYVLSKLKGQFPTVVMADKKTAVANQAEDATKGVQMNKDELAVASTSYQSPKKHVLLKSIHKPFKKPRISTHVMDTSKGLPIGGLQVSLYKLMDGRWTFLNESNTSPNGRCIDLVDNTKVNFTTGRYKIHFDVDKYFTLRRIETMYPFIEIVFDVKNPASHYHIPVLLSPFGYTTYRGSER
ncbi:hypothetical protein WN51_07838 [Melipona quadrifasciata]|uniref:hydroxyisourate hydrolase n=1 Tax=Melipona quadrifasciata TaxID=166423 RepID=A0A0N0BIZ1_9HYME|nr:hypothetical protein WN51_07838 [Melipona quadrifasciata]